jgi:lysophospholipase L1-like esterase
MLRMQHALPRQILIALSFLATTRPWSAVAADAAAAAEPPPAHAAAFEHEIRAFELTDRVIGAAPRVVFIGSSSIRVWETIGMDFPRHRVVNRGFGGSHIADSTYFANRILSSHRPPVIVMYAGGNDIDAGKTAPAVAADFKAFTVKVWASWPKATIAFISIGPSPTRWTEVATVREANRLISAYCETDARLRFIDIFPLMLGADGRPRRELYVDDGLHMTRKGYLLWIPAIEAVLEKLDPSPAPPKAK